MDRLIRIIALSTIPAIIYTFIERGILRMNTTIMGARYACGYILELVFTTVD
jgi:hypothetical protein